nr:MAG TPA: hypothetical protein [Caudoviricetes sp.]
MSFKPPDESLKIKTKHSVSRETLCCGVSR